MGVARGVLQSRSRRNALSYGSTRRHANAPGIVTVPVGYGDGYQCFNTGHVILRGRTYLQGRVCMDQLLVDIGGDSAWNGDSVTLLGEAEGHVISAESIARAAGTIPYEVLTNINTRSRGCIAPRDGRIHAPVSGTCGDGRCRAGDDDALSGALPGSRRRECE